MTGGGWALTVQRREDPGGDALAFLFVCALVALALGAFWYVLPCHEVAMPAGGRHACDPGAYVEVVGDFTVCRCPAVSARGGL